MVERCFLNYSSKIVTLINRLEYRYNWHKNISNENKFSCTCKWNSNSFQQ